jgi:hypothetical protein
MAEYPLSALLFGQYLCMLMTNMIFSRRIDVACWSLIMLGLD